MLEDNDLKRITTQWFQEIVMTFFMEHTMAYLDAFVNKQGTSLKMYKHVMENIFLAKRNCSTQYTKLQNFEGF
jgi:hypothetical protein